MFQMDSVLSHILVQGEGDTFYRFSNADGKQWLMPARHMVVAMNLYQPSHWKGLLVKAGLPYLHGVGAVRRFLHTDPERCRLSDELYAILCRAFRVERLEFSLFGGTPGVHQKLTMQVSVGNRILGYGKLSDRPAIIDLFQREAELLDGLKQKGMTEVPEALFCGQLAGNIGLFVQSTLKTRHSQVPHRWSALHEDFLKKMYLLLPVFRGLFHMHGEARQRHFRENEQFRLILFCLFYKILCFFHVLLYIFPEDIHLCQSDSHNLLLFLPLPSLTLSHLYETDLFCRKICVKEGVAFSVSMC